MHITDRRQWYYLLIFILIGALLYFVLGDLARDWKRYAQRNNSKIRYQSLQEAKIITFRGSKKWQIHTYRYGE